MQIPPWTFRGRLDCNGFVKESQVPSRSVDVRGWLHGAEELSRSRPRRVPHVAAPPSGAEKAPAHAGAKARAESGCRRGDDRPPDAERQEALALGLTPAF